MQRFWSRKTLVAPNGEKSRGVFEPNAKPDFLCVGAPKAGTSWLCHQLKRHPDFWMPPLKEVNYFDHMSRFTHPDRATRRSIRVLDDRDRHFVAAMEDLCNQQHIDLDRYAQLFAPKGILLSGDISPAYCVVPEEIIARIIERFPELKVIFMVRDPVERAWSDLFMGVRTGGMRPFDTTKSDLVILKLLNPVMLMRSFQSASIARWQRHVSPARFRVFFFDDLQSDPAEMRRSVARFLGGDPERFHARAKAERKINETQDKLPLTQNVRSQVARFFEQEMKTCAANLGGPAKNWPARYGLLSLLWLVQFFSDCDFAVDLLMLS